MVLFRINQHKVIFADKGKKIGKFIRNCKLERSKFLWEKKNDYINKYSKEYFQFKKNNNINIEMIPKPNSIVICLSFFYELTNEFNKYSQEEKRIIKLFSNLFNIFCRNNHDNVINQIACLTSSNKKLTDVFIELFNFIEGELPPIPEKEQNSKEDR